jgi:signal transduction histidine kinase
MSMSKPDPDRAGLQQRIVPVLAATCLLLAAGAGLPLAWENPVALTIVLVLVALLLALVIISWRQAARMLIRQRSDRDRIARLEAEKADLEIFVNAATHDLHEPLRKIQVFGDRLRDQLGLLPDPAIAQPLDRMTAAAGRMRDLLDALLVHVRVRDDRTAITSVDLDAVLAGILEDRASGIQAVKAKIESDPLGMVEADAVQMRTLLENLIDNALKYRTLEASVNILIRTRTDGDKAGGHVTIEIIDNGIGFDPRHAERIFGLFERLHARDAYPGAGVGLATCRKIAEHHGGVLSARGEPGAGACFTLILPRRQANLSPDPAQRAD